MLTFPNAPSRENTEMRVAGFFSATCVDCCGRALHPATIKASKRVDFAWAADAISTFQPSVLDPLEFIR
jgi:hypothetical protein